MRIRSNFRPPGYRTAQLVVVPAVAGLLAFGGLFTSCSGDEQDQGNSPRRSDIVTESIQLTPCQQSAAACFASGGLDTLTENLDGLATDPVTGRFCFAFQEGCRR